MWLQKPEPGSFTDENHDVQFANIDLLNNLQSMQALVTCIAHWTCSSNAKCCQSDISQDILYLLQNDNLTAEK